jgi:hypothetical protein
MKIALIFLTLSIVILPNNDNIQQQLNKVNKNFFIENKGQWPTGVTYLAKVGGMNVWIMNSGVVYDYFKIIRNYAPSETMKMTHDTKEEFEMQNTTIKGHVVKMSLVDANTECTQQANNKQDEYYNYFIGNDKNKWASFIPLYGDVEQKDIYNNINVKYYFDGNSIRYDYIVKPGADLSQLRLKFEGQESIRVNNAGELVIKTCLGEVTNGKLYAYQISNELKTEVPCRFTQNEDGTISFFATNYDKDKEFIIDPLVYSTFLGGESAQQPWAMTIDDSLNAYLTGYTYSQYFPITNGAYQSTIKEHCDIFVTKLNPTGTGLIFSTYIGGDQWDWGRAIATDKEGNVFITGDTWSSYNYPTTPGAFQTTYGGGASDIIVTKLNPTGSSVLYSTFIGGNLSEAGQSIAVDSAGNAYFTGGTYSPNYPTTAGAFQTTLGGTYYNAFITKLNSSGTGLVYSTYIGGSNTYAYSLALDRTGNVFITGHTYSSNYPTTTGAYQTNYAGGGDAFVTKLNPTGSNLVFSTYIGGNYEDIGTSITIDIDGNVYLTGNAQPNFPTTLGAYQSMNAGGYHPDAFISKLNSTGSILIYSTYIGGWGNDQSNSIVIDSARNAYITGITYSPNYPTTSGSFQSSYKGGECDAFLTKLNTEGTGLSYSTYLGGIGNDGGFAIDIGPGENTYITGFTGSPNFPTTSGAFQTNYNLGGGVFITKLNVITVPLIITAPNGNEYWKAGDTKRIVWEAVNISSIKIQYSSDNGLSWNIITNSYPAGIGYYDWVVPSIISDKNFVKITDLNDTNIFIISHNPFKIWEPLTNIQTPVVGQNSLNFGQTNLTLNMFILTPSSITVAYYEGELPRPGSLPPEIIGITPYYWNISSDNAISFNNGFINAPLITLRGIGTDWTIVWLMRENIGDAWTNIGGMKIDGNIVNTVPFSAFSEFTLGIKIIPTPVELAAFNANIKGEVVQLHWNTSTETNNRGFEIQRRSSTYDYITVAFIRGQGTSTKNSDYSWSEKLEPGKYSYRLKQFDYNGCFNYSNSVDVIIIPKRFSLSQNYPNPWNPSTNIKYSIPKDSPVSIKVFDILGNEMKTLVNEEKPAGNYELTFNAADLPSGVYFYRIQAGNFVETKKMILMK